MMHYVGQKLEVPELQAKEDARTKKQERHGGAKASEQRNTLVFGTLKQRNRSGTPARATMQVELAVPAGIQPGQQLEFEMNGQKHRVSVPSGVGPGQHFRVEIPDAAPQPAPQPAPPAGMVQMKIKVAAVWCVRRQQVAGAA